MSLRNVTLTLGYTFILVTAGLHVYGQSKEFKELRSEHFIVYYSQGIDERYASRIINRVEDYYRTITQEFNLVRSKLWLWENRAKVYIAKDKTQYLGKFKCPSWSGACVDYHNKMIYTYPNQENFSSIFIHELTHIIFREYIGTGRLPLWLDEAMATYIEQKHGSGHYQRMLYVLKDAIANGRYIKFSELPRISSFSLNGAAQNDVDLFYIESYSIVSFIIKRYGRDNFAQFLFHLRNGLSVEGALSRSFLSVKTFGDLERAWKIFYLDQ